MILIWMKSHLFRINYNNNNNKKDSYIQHVYLMIGILYTHNKRNKQIKREYNMPTKSFIYSSKTLLKVGPKVE